MQLAFIGVLTWCRDVVVLNCVIMLCYFFSFWSVVQSDVSHTLWSAVAQFSGKFQCVCGVPYTALPMATVSA